MQNAEAEDYDDAPARENGVFGRVLSYFRGHEEEPDDREEAAAEAHSQAQPQPAPVPTRATGGSYSPLRRGTTLRMDQSRQTHITVRRAIQTFDDARRAADGPQRRSAADCQPGADVGRHDRAHHRLPQRRDLCARRQR